MSEQALHLEDGPVDDAPGLSPAQLRRAWEMLMIRLGVLMEMYLQPGGQTQSMWKQITEVSAAERAAYRTYLRASL